jgi:hypothetical protein
MSGAIPLLLLTAFTASTWTDFTFRNNNKFIFSVKHNNILLSALLSTSFGHTTIIRPSSDHHQAIIRPSSGQHQTIIRPTSDHHQTIIMPLSGQHQTIIRPSVQKV